MPSKCENRDVAKTAVILAGGLGTRLRPFTIVLPKPLVPLGELPILEHLIIILRNQGFERFILAVNHQADLIKAYFGDGSRLQVVIEYSVESTRLGTVGPLKIIEDLPEKFLVLNGDVVCDVDFADFYDEFSIQDDRLVPLITSRGHKVDFGVIETNKNGALKVMREKPEMSLQVLTGIYMFSSVVVDWIPSGVNFGIDDLIRYMLENDMRVRTKLHEGFWLDIGRPEDYEIAQALRMDKFY